jgi:hypothetical protein
MKSYIKYIGVIDKSGVHHYVEFYEGLNIITGKSSTGKSAMIEIFDYCFGNSEDTVPEGIITERAQLYFVVMQVAEGFLVLARKPKQDKGFIKIETNLNVVKDIKTFSIDYFQDFISLTDFKKELSKCFGIDITDTDTDLEDRKHRYNNKKKESPTARHFTSFMLQHQNLIANKHSLFYRFDEKEKRDQTIEQFNIFAGFVNQDYFLKKQKLNELERDMKKLADEKGKNQNYQLSITERLKGLLADYQIVAGLPLLKDDVEEIIAKPISSLKKIERMEIVVDENSDENVKARTELVNQRNTMIADKRRQQMLLQNISGSIVAIEQYQHKSQEIDTINEVKLPVSLCPFCDTPHEQIAKEANELSDAIEWLNSELSKSLYVVNSLKSEEKQVQLVIQSKSEEIRNINAKIGSIEEIISKLENNRSLNEQAIKIKFRIESLLEEIKNIDNSDIDEKIRLLDEQIAGLRNDIKNNYDTEVKRANAERIINERMNDFGSNLDFESFYKPINLKFSLETFDLYHEMKSGKKIYLRSMGSGANWLYSHLALFTSLQYYFCSLGAKGMVPPILFIDQPSQVYFPNSVDTKKEFNPEELTKATFDENDIQEKVKEKSDEDLLSVTRMFNELVKHCNYTKIKTGILPQIIVTDHADNLQLEGEISFEDFVAGRRWRERGFINKT